MWWCDVRGVGFWSLITDPEQLPREAIWTGPAWRTGGKQRRGKPWSATRDRRPSVWECRRAGDVCEGEAMARRGSGRMRKRREVCRGLREK